MCGKFQLDWYMHSCFIVENASVRNEEKKTKQKKKLLLGLAGVTCFKFGIRLAYQKGISVANLVGFG